MLQTSLGWTAAVRTSCTAERRRSLRVFARTQDILAVKASDALGVHVPSFAPQQDMDATIGIPRTSGRETLDSLSNISFMTLRLGRYSSEDRLKRNVMARQRWLTPYCS